MRILEPRQAVVFVLVVVIVGLILGAVSDSEAVSWIYTAAVVVVVLGLIYRARRRAR